jgi:putative transposase
MSRALRIAVADGWYHVTARGIERRAIFRDSSDHRHFTELLSLLPERFGVRVVAYVLMGNHYHLILQTPRANLSTSMQWLNVSYGIWFNRRHHRCGPLFQGRFKGILLEDEGARLFEVAAYVHLNPVRVKALGLGKMERGAEKAGLLPAPSEEVVEQRWAVLRGHRWSSYPAYAGYAPAPRWLSTRDLLARVPGRGPDRVRRYREAVETTLRQGLSERPWARLKAQVVLGTEGFWRGLRVKGNRSEITALRNLEKRTEWADLVRAVETIRQEAWLDFRDRHGDAGRDLALAAARERCAMTLRQLGEAAGGMHYAAVSQAIRTFKARRRRDRELQETWKRLMHALDT